MNILSHIRKSHPFGLRSWGMLLILVSGICGHAQAQIKIGGNVYGGGDMGNVGGNTVVHVLSGDLGTDSQTNPGGSVFGGARMADVNGNAFVNIDGKNAGATNYMIINRVYGGNDISGNIGGDKATAQSIIPSELDSANRRGIDATWDAFVHISNSHEENDGVISGTDIKSIYIGQLFGGGNGDYKYTFTVDAQTGDTTFIISDKNDNPIVTSSKDFNYPDIDKTYVEIDGGSIVYAYAGGNLATVNKSTVISMANPSNVVNEIIVNNVNLLSPERFKAMGINTGFSKPSSAEYQIGRLFGGNNLAEMSIRPEWYLEGGKVRNLYSGGNKGHMTNKQGLLLDIDPYFSDRLVIDYVYGGSRMADVRPLRSGTYDKNPENALASEIVLPETVVSKAGTSYDFPEGLAARVIVRGGEVHNVYGGNDVTGQVYGGNAVGIYTSIAGNVYGGGNGSYPYTDNPKFEGHDIYGDFYYGNYYGQDNSIDKLNDFRPDAEQISIRLKGKSESEPTVIKGSVFLGGNSATIVTDKEDPLVHLRIGSYVIAENLYMGNNGADMVTINPEKKDNNGTLIEQGGILWAMASDSLSGNGTKFNSIDFTKKTYFDKYMDGVAMSLNPQSDRRITYDADYVPYTAQIGSFYCGGNVGSMNYAGTMTMDFNTPIIIYDKLVGGCKDADVPQTIYNYAYQGGVLGDAKELAADGLYRENKAADGAIQDRLIFNLNGVRVKPQRWDEAVGRLVYNTVTWDDTEGDFVPVAIDEGNDEDRRLKGGNIYGGCYNSGHVNGNIVININDTIIDRFDGSVPLFADGNDSRSGVILDEQSWDVMMIAMTTFGAGKGELTEVWGSTNVNLNRGYVMQIFGGGEEGYVGRGDTVGYYADGDYKGYYLKDYSKYDRNNANGLEDNDPAKLAFSTTVNLNGTVTVYNADDNPVGLAETEFLYGAGNEGDVCGNSYVYLGNGRIFDAFGGASDADIYGHTEVYIGRNKNGDDRFPYVRDIVYGGSDFGGSILGEGDMSARVRDAATKAMVYNPNNKQTPDVLKAASYVEYLQGFVDTIFGGSYGFYDYYDTDEYEYADDGSIRTMPFQHSSFVNIRPNTNNNTNNTINAIFGAGTGWPGDRRGDAAQDRSYVLIDIPEYQTESDNRFRYTQIFGSGSYNGLGMKYSYATTTTQDNQGNSTFNQDSASAIIDLIRGQVGAAYGASYMEGVTRRTVVNVPTGSTINIGSIFGGGYGTDVILPCDAYDANVNWNSGTAWLKYDPNTSPLFKGAIYGGNNNNRRTVYSKVNISARLNQLSYKYGKTTGYVYGAGYGPTTWTEYTEVNLENGANVYEVYGGGENGLVMNAASIQARMNDDAFKASEQPDGMSDSEWDAIWDASWRLGGQGYDPESISDLAANKPTNIENESPLFVRQAEIDDRSTKTYKYNTNVIIKEGAWVGNYAYGGGYGENAVVSGSTYIALLGGGVNKDIYAAGTSGSVEDLHNAGFTATATAYIEGGTVRNVYGGGWRGSVGHANYTPGKKLYDKDGTVVYEQVPNFYENGVCTDLLGESHVVIGKIDGTSHIDGIPSITRNVYGGGEGGAIFGTAYTTVYNGYIGYRYKDGEYVEENDDASVGDNVLAKNGGNVFGGGYVANSYVDDTKVKMFGGFIRGSLFGGGEIAPVGRGTVLATATVPQGQPVFTNSDAKIFKSGKTSVKLYSGQVGKNVFGGGRGYDNWNGSGYMTKVEEATMDLSSRGYVFGETEVYIYGGKVGTKESAVQGDGNVFGGGDEGFVYSAIGTKSPTDGYYYNSTNLTEDCKVIISPYAQIKPIKVKNNIVQTINSNTVTLYNANEYITIQQFQEIPTAVRNNLVKGTDWEYDNSALTVNSTDFYPVTYAANLSDPSQAYVPTSTLNNLTNNELGNLKARLDNTGVVIGNAVFAGGNVSAGSDNIYVNATSVYGNATASVTDVFAKDLITIGEDGIGGLYGDGNLTFVDGYRELNITNYGTDYYNLDQELTYDEYKLLTDRERAYFELLYAQKGGAARQLSYYESKNTHTVTVDDVPHTYKRGQKLPIGSTEYNKVIAVEGESANWVTVTDKTYIATLRISQDELELFWEEEQENWELYGFCTLYAGRMINTIQRADFCGVFGSRVVMRGAQDRVPKTVDYTEYTINRVKEVSLNVVKDPTAPNNNKLRHGNYFGIYNVVNYLGALTSDVSFNATRETNKEGEAVKTYYDWKQDNLGNRKRNDASSPNEVALASGVWLEILSDSTETEKKKIYGPITGVVELTLINVAPGEGGGYVYAKNVHGTQVSSGNLHTTLAAANYNAISCKQFKYTPGQVTSDVAEDHKMQSSGNFVNPAKRIIDDCYPNSGAYYARTGGETVAPAHYWFIRGDYYIYDQYISAYTGSAQSYAENVTIPLTITAEAQGKITLADIKPNKYAYWEDLSQSQYDKYRSQTDANAIMVGGKTYKLNDPITYWDWNHLTADEKLLFEEMTWVCTNDATYDGHPYKKGDVFKTAPQQLYVCKEAFKEGTTQYEKGHVFTAAEYAALTGETSKSSCAAVFNITNAITHDNGFLLTFDWDNPDVWNDYYHAVSGDDKIKSSEYNRTDYLASPTFKFTGSGTQVLGQLSYSVGDIIDQETYDYQSEIYSSLTETSKTKQANFDKTYIAIAQNNFTVNNVQYVPYATISKATYDSFSNEDKENFDEAILCTSLYEYLDNNEVQYVAPGTIMPLGKADGSESGTYNYIKKFYNGDQEHYLDPADFFCDGYICTVSGLWGGSLFTNSTNYRAISYSNLSNADRKNRFSYNYDALDLLVDSTYSGSPGYMSMYDMQGGTPLYSAKQSIDYEATYTGTNTLNLGKTVNVKYYDDTEHQFVTQPKTSLVEGDIIVNKDFEALTNEALNYAPITVTPTDKTDTIYYVVKEGFQIGDKWYSEGNQMSFDIWDGLSQSDQAKVTKVRWNTLTGGNTVSSNTTYYICITPYNTIGELSNLNNKHYQANDTINAGTIINASNYALLKNEQKDFTINGKAPTETSTIYVARDVDINSLSQDKIITVTYYYDYTESDETGSSYEKVREFHIVNVHVHFESGLPSVGELMEPNTVLPGNLVRLNQPTVTKGAYDILGGGWEIYPDERSADSHRNGIPFSAGTNPLYWYQDGYMIAYYALSYLGKSYSNAVPLSVANYHRMDDIIDLVTEGNNVTVTTDNNYMYLNEAVKNHKRNPKIYVGNDAELNKMALFYNETLNQEKSDYLEYVQGAADLEFILDSDIKHTGTWTSIAQDDCFAGNLHGDGYTISGLDHALFNSLCGNVYNLGVTGSFNDAGIANAGSGYIENSWISTTSTAAKTTAPVFGNPSRNETQINNLGEIQLVNSYYMENDDAATTAAYSNRPENSTVGAAIRKPAQSFYNGEVAFDLNGFYLNKRYYDGIGRSTAYDGKEFTSNPSYLYIDPKIAVSDQLETTSPEYNRRQLMVVTYDTDKPQFGNYRYVDDRYADGDFRYSGGSVPTWTDDHERTLMYKDQNNLDIEKTVYAPIWPDDYIFFGQDLTFGHVDERTHQQMPSHISNTNRVYRAPAYYGDSVMNVAYFNPNAVLVDKEKLTSEQIAANAKAHDAFPGMTAIDFTGYRDTEYTQGLKNATTITPETFYAPLLDMSTLTGFRNDGQTKNMLVYADGTANADESTLTVLKNYLVEPQYSYYANVLGTDSQTGEPIVTDDTNPYGEIRKVDNVTVNNVHGHLVLKKAADDYQAATDHFLVDKNELDQPFDFNAPISYTMGSRTEGNLTIKNLMWYQRTPDIFVQNAGTGWESISLPFTSQVVTTSDKGVITHFYQGTGNDIGHEYWLRTPNQIDQNDANTTKVLFQAIAQATQADIDAGNGAASLLYENNFLWEYYYSKNSNAQGKPGRDENNDLYQEEYYSKPQTYTNYPYGAATVPYLIGFPSSRYYEFDLSGEFVAQNTATTGPAKLGKQTITFVSNADGSVRINVSDQDYKTMTPVANGSNETYNFKPTYQARQLDVQDTYLLDAQTGTAFRKSTDATVTTVPFRAYFSGNSNAGRAQSRSGSVADALYIGYIGSNDQLEDRAVQGGLNIYSQNMNIIVESTLEYETQVTIYTVAGKLLKRFNIKPASKVTVPVNNRGVYIVNRVKIAVTK